MRSFEFSSARIRDSLLSFPSLPRRPGLRSSFSCPPLPRVFANSIYMASPFWISLFRHLLLSIFALPLSFPPSFDHRRFRDRQWTTPFYPLRIRLPLLSKIRAVVFFLPADRLRAALRAFVFNSDLAPFFLRFLLMDHAHFCHILCRSLPRLGTFDLFRIPTRSPFCRMIFVSGFRLKVAEEYSCLSYRLLRS